jgi:hypothetical protein
VDDDQRSGGVSPEKKEQLRHLLSTLEDLARKRGQDPTGVAELSTEITKIRKTVESGQRTTLFREIFKSVRNIAEGIVGAAIYDLIPTDLKRSLTDELLEAPQDPRRADDRHLYVVRIPIMMESVPAFEAAVDSHFPFALTLGGLEMHIWCGPELAAALRLMFEASGIEHPTEVDLGLRLRVLTPRQAELLKAGLAEASEQIALAILSVRPGSEHEMQQRFERAADEALAKIPAISPFVRPRIPRQNP